MTCFAQSIGGCRPPQREDGSPGKCGQCDNEVLSEFDQLLASAESDAEIEVDLGPVPEGGVPTELNGQVEVRNGRMYQQKKARTVDDFVRTLPEEIRRNFIFMSDSRSFQRSDFNNPRTLMRSESSELVVSFGGHKNLNGSNREYLGEDRVEVMQWNGAEGRFDFIDIQFPQESDPPEVGARPIVEKNPQKCLNCHGGGQTLPNGEPDLTAVRPNWDPYNFWAGQIPFNRDTLGGGTVEREAYLRLIRQAEGNLPRMGALLPPYSSDQIAARTEGTGSFMISAPEEGPGGDGPGVRMFDTLTPRNFCRIGNRLKDQLREDDGSIPLAFALQGAMNGCTNMQDFLPDQDNETSERYFEARNIASPNGDFDYPELFKDTEERQRSIYRDKAARQLWMIERDLRRRHADGQEPFANSTTPMDDDQFERMALAEMNAVTRNGFGSLQDRENYEQNVPAMSGFRYLLEPMGIKVENWSMTTDPSSYTFADLFGQFSRYLPELPESYSGGRSCAELAEASKAALEGARNYRTQLNENTCNETIAIDQGLPTESLNEAAIAAMRDGVTEVFEYNGCIGCHDNGVNDAPELPFSDLSQLEEWIKDTATDPNGGWAQMIWNRLNKREGARGQMPLGMPNISPEERETLRTYLGAVRQLGSNGEAPAIRLDDLDKPGFTPGPIQPKPISPALLGDGGLNITGTPAPGGGGDAVSPPPGLIDLTPSQFNKIPSIDTVAPTPSGTIEN